MAYLAQKEIDCSLPDCVIDSIVDKTIANSTEEKKQKAREAAKRRRSDPETYLRMKEASMLCNRKRRAECPELTVQCGCGVMVQKASLSKHLQSRRHKEAIVSVVSQSTTQD